jgi:dihydroflavonol-4-reductase
MILVTGSTGHIGNVLVRKLLKDSEQVRVLLLPGENTTPLEGLNVERIEGNVLDYPSLLKAFQDIQVVYHLAGIISIMPGENELLHLVNVLGTRNVIEAACSTGVKRLVYTSSIHAIARAPQGVLIDERIPYDPNNPYGAYDRSKARASLDVLEAARCGLDAVVVCPTGVIGPYDFRGSDVGHIIRSCAANKPQLYVDGAYDFVDVRDVADGLILACERGNTGESYILSGERINIPSMLDTIQEITGKVFLKIKIPFKLARFTSKFMPYYYRLSQTAPRFTPYSLEVLCSNSHISHRKARCELGFSPRDLHESIRDTVNWFLENSQPILTTTTNRG